MRIVAQWKSPHKTTKLVKTYVQFLFQIFISNYTEQLMN